MVIYEIRYRLGSNNLEEKLLNFIKEQRIIKKAGSGKIDDIRLITGMRIVHYGGLSYSEGKEMNLTPEEDIIDISVMVGQIHAFYRLKDNLDFTIIQMHGQKYMLQVSFNTMLELSRLLKSSARQFSFAEKIDQDLRNDGSISKEK